MLRALMNLFRSEDPLRAMGEDFLRMLRLTVDMTVQAGNIFFSGQGTPEARTALYKTDIQVNQLERKIRKRIVAHLSLPGHREHVPYGLAMMSLVKDVERLGDYAKNVAEIVDLHSEELPEDDVKRELVEIRRAVDALFGDCIRVFENSDAEAAAVLIQQGRNVAKRCDALLYQIARGPYEASTTTAFVLGARYYKRIGGHVLNVLSSVVMPLHKIDYYDEDNLTDALSGDAD